MRLAVAGLSHHTASIEVREQVALGPADVRAALGRLRPLAEEAVVLSTCNRTELYAVLGDETEVASAANAAFACTGVPVGPYLFTYEGEDAARHLFRVASGVDSLVFGEAEILGQIRRAWEMARAAGATGPLTSRLFQQGLAVGKRVRARTEIGRFPASVSSAAVALAKDALDGDLSRSTVLVIGVGEVGEGVVRCLLGNGVTGLLVANHRTQRAQDLAERYDAVGLPWPIPPASLAKADVIISATGAEGFVLHPDEVRAAMALRDEGLPLHLVDMAVPRDIDPQVALLPGVRLQNLDDIETVIAATLEKRQQAQPQADAIVAQQTGLFGRWLRERQVASSIQELREKGEAIRLAELAWALPKLASLSERERKVVSRLTSRLLNKLLHGPTTRYRRAVGRGRGQEYRELVQELFDLTGAASDAEPAGQEVPDQTREREAR